MYKKRDARQGSCFAHSMELKKIAFLTFSLPSPLSLRSLNSNYEHNFCLFSTASIIYTFNKFCSTELSFKDHAWGVLPIMAYTGRLRPTGVPFSGFRYMKGWGFYSLKYTKGWGNLSFGSVKGPKRSNR